MTWSEFFKKSPMWKAFMCFLAGGLIAGITGLQSWEHVIALTGYVGLFTIACRLLEANDESEK